MAERVRAYGALDDPGHRTGCNALTSQLEQGTDGARSFQTTAEGPEVLQAKQPRRFIIEPSKINFNRQLGDLIAVQRIRRHTSIAQPVNVAAPNRPEAGVKSSWRY